MKTFSTLILTGAVVFIGLQMVRPDIPAKPAQAELQAPPEVKDILRKSCYSCHSDERRLSWFDQIVPAYWLARSDVLKGRTHLNFSTLGSQSAAAQRATLFEAANMMQLGAMPLPRFVKLHPEAAVTPRDLAILKAYLAPWQPSAENTEARAESAQLALSSVAPIQVSLKKVQPEPNGILLDGGFENWRPISITDRGDNNTFRFILGNEIAIRARQSGTLSPWPDGSRLAKIAWQQAPGTDGLIHPGKFVQVELMVKNAHRYRGTRGWGWGRWRGSDLKPYGADVRFVNECTGCHLPMRDNDNVYTLPITTAHIDDEEVVNNHAAALPASLPYQPLGWNAITMYVDPATRTMATLYGNEEAMQAVRATRAVGPARAGGLQYKTGSILALVTWVQRDDPHWFGARIPDAPQSVEFLQILQAGQGTIYRCFQGDSLTESSPAPDTRTRRTKLLQGLAPVWLP